MRPRGPLTESMTIAVTLEDGSIQNFLVTSDDRRSETIVLRPFKKEQYQAPYMSSSLEARSTTALKALFQGKTPVGYKVVDRKVAGGKRWFGQVRFKPLDVFSGSYDTITVFAVRNEGEDPVELCEKKLRSHQDLWAFLGKRQLKKGEKTLFIVARKGRYE